MKQYALFQFQQILQFIEDNNIIIASLKRSVILNKTYYFHAKKVKMLNEWN